MGPGNKNPKLFKAVGKPPSDLLNDVARAWAAAGMDVGTCLDAGAVVIRQRLYTLALPCADPRCNVQDKLRHVREETTQVKLQLFSVKHILNPQPHATAAVHALLFWINELEKSPQRCEAKPPFTRPDRSFICYCITYYNIT